MKPQVKPNSPRAWLLATRPHTLPASASPVLAASALAAFHGSFRLVPALICLVFALVAQVVSNLANDYFDYKKGADNEERLGPPRAVTEGWISPRRMLTVTLALLAFDCLLGLSLVWFAGWQLISVGVLIAVFALAYSGGPYPLAYHGWGDVCVFIFFGLVPVVFTFYVQTLVISPDALLVGAALGLVSINILVANNYRDRDTDRAAGKKTTIVLFGARFGRYFYLLNGIIAVILCQYFWKVDAPFAALLPCIYLFLHLFTWRKMLRINQGKALIPVLQETARNVFLFSILLSAGLFLTKS